MEFDAEALLLTFIAETEENLRTIEEGLLALERQPDDAEVLQTIFRMAHTLKGNSASLGFTGVAEFAHALEDQLERLRKRSRPVTAGLVTALLEAVDAVREMLPVAVEGNHEISAGAPGGAAAAVLGLGRQGPFGPGRRCGLRARGAGPRAGSARRRVGPHAPHRDRQARPPHDARGRDRHLARPSAVCSSRRTRFRAPSRPTRTRRGSTPSSRSS